MYQNAIEKIRRSIFPVFFQVTQGNRITLGVSGTGFFVTHDGHFLTANHVITNVPPGATLLYAGNVPYQVLPKLIELEQVFQDAVNDVFVGRVNTDPLPPVPLADTVVRPGQTLCLSGYPLARLSRNPDGAINMANVRPYWQPTFVIDGFAATIDSHQYRGFITQHTSLRGMSGGPVFDPRGLVYGMDVATMTRRIPEPNNRETTVPNGVVEGINALLEVVPDDLGRWFVRSAPWLRWLRTILARGR